MIHTKGKQMLDFANKVAMVTGGSSGIGRAACLAFAGCGAMVVVAARRAAEGRATVEQIVSRGGRAVFVETDVLDEAQMANLVQQALHHFGAVHIAFNNAGVGGDMKPVNEASLEAWNTVMATNVGGIFAGIKCEVPAMLESGGGAIINMSSVYGMAGKAAHHAYVASKHAVIGLTRSVAIELAREGIRVNAVCPGGTDTQAMQAARQQYPAAVERLVDAHPMRRLATESEVASAVLWLASDHASYVTGHALAVDGGFLAA